jgi:hypothetical protein
VFFENEPLPFIIKDNKYEWHVPVNDVTISDFMITHEIEDGGVLTINEVGIGAGDPHFYIYELVSWVLALWPIVSTATTLPIIVKGVTSIYRKLIGKDKKPVLPYELLELLNSREEWTMAEIKRITHCNNEKDLEILLLQGGFRKIAGKYIKTYTKSKEILSPKQNYMEFLSNVAKECWGDYGYDKKTSSVSEAIHQLNCALTNLLLQSENSNSDYFTFILIIIESFVDEWDEFVCRGDKLQFVIIKKDYGKFYQNEADRRKLNNRLKMLEHDVRMLIGFTYRLSEKVERDALDIDAETRYDHQS